VKTDTFYLYDISRYEPNRLSWPRGAGKTHRATIQHKKLNRRWRFALWFLAIFGLTIVHKDITRIGDKFVSSVVYRHKGLGVEYSPFRKTVAPVGLLFIHKIRTSNDLTYRGLYGLAPISRSFMIDCFQIVGKNPEDPLAVATKEWDKVNWAHGMDDGVEWFIPLWKVRL